MTIVIVTALDRETYGEDLIELRVGFVRLHLTPSEAEKVATYLREHLDKADQWEGWIKSEDPCVKCDGQVYTREVNDTPNVQVTCSECLATYIVNWS